MKKLLTIVVSFLLGALSVSFIMGNKSNKTKCSDCRRHCSTIDNEGKLFINWEEFCKEVPIDVICKFNDKSRELVKSEKCFEFVDYCELNETVLCLNMRTGMFVELKYDSDKDEIVIINYDGEDL